MIYATLKDRHHPQVFSFDTRIQSKVENAMYAMGHGSHDYVLSSDPGRYSSGVPRYSSRVRILDKHGHLIQIRA